MVMSIYKKALAIYAKKPFTFWGISLLYGLVTFGVSILFGAVVGIPVAITYALSVGLAYIFLAGYNGEELKASDIFICFTDWKTTKRVIGGYAWKDLWVFLWSLIPVVGWIFAIIKHYSYALTPYILAKEPEISATEAMKVSAARAKGYRGKMFGADLLAYVFFALIVLAFYVVITVLKEFQVVALIFAILLVAFVVVALISLPLYMNLVRAGFYAEIMAKQENAE